MNAWLATLAIVSLLAASGGPARRKSAEAEPPVPAFEPAGCTVVIDNPYFPLRAGVVRVYETGTGKAAEVDTVVVLRETRPVLGVEAVAVRSRAYRGGTLVEESLGWYVQDRRGNVWSLGEDRKDLRDSAAVSTAGSWEAGVDSASAGIVMPAVPEPDLRYRKAYRRGRVEEWAEVRNLDSKATVLGETFTACVETDEWSALDRNRRERCVYAPGLGLAVRSTPGGIDRTKLVKLIAP